MAFAEIHRLYIQMKNETQGTFKGRMAKPVGCGYRWRMSVEDRQPLRVVCHFPDSSVFELSPQEPKTIYINNPGGEEWDVKCLHKRGIH